MSEEKNRISAAILEKLTVLDARFTRMEEDINYMKGDITQIKRDMATKEELKAVEERMATKEELQKLREEMATKEELRKVREEMATKEELQKLREEMATKEELKVMEGKMVTREEFNEKFDKLDKQYIQIVRFIKGFNYFIRGLNEFSHIAIEEDFFESPSEKSSEKV